MGIVAGGLVGGLVGGLLGGLLGFVLGSRNKTDTESEAETEDKENAMETSLSRLSTMGNVLAIETEDKVEEAETEDKENADAMEASFNNITANMLWGHSEKSKNDNELGATEEQQEQAQRLTLALIDEIFGASTDDSDHANAERTQDYDSEMDRSSDDEKDEELDLGNRVKGPVVSTGMQKLYPRRKKDEWVRLNQFSSITGYGANLKISGSEAVWAASGNMEANQAHLGIFLHAWVYEKMLKQVTSGQSFLAPGKNIAHYSGILKRGWVLGRSTSGRIQFHELSRNDGHFFRRSDDGKFEDIRGWDRATAQPVRQSSFSRQEREDFEEQYNGGWTQEQRRRVAIMIRNPRTAGAQLDKLRSYETIDPRGYVLDPNRMKKSTFNKLYNSQGHRVDGSPLDKIEAKKFWDEWHPSRKDFR